LLSDEALETQTKTTGLTSTDNENKQTDNL